MERSSLGQEQLEEMEGESRQQIPNVVATKCHFGAADEEAWCLKQGDISASPGNTGASPWSTVFIAGLCFMNDANWKEFSAKQCK